MGFVGGMRRADRSYAGGAGYCIEWHGDGGE
jgi:hypothetical protein